MVVVTMVIVTVMVMVMVMVKGTKFSRYTNRVRQVKELPEVVP